MKKNNKGKMRKNKLINIFIVLFFFIGLILVFSKPIKNILINKNVNHYQINNVSRELIKENDKVKGDFYFDEVEPLSSEFIARSQINNQPMPVIGGIAIPEIGINLPIFKGVSNINLAYGAGTMKENQIMGHGNYALSSHNVTGFNINKDLLFTPLEHAKTGMVIYVTDKESIYQYRIDKISIVSPEHVEVINDHVGKSEITLVTCADPKAVNRIIVHGTFENNLNYADRSDDMKDAFLKSYNQIL